MYRRSIKAFSSVPLPNGYSIFDKARPDYPIHAVAHISKILNIHRSSSALFDVVEIDAEQGKLTKALKRVLKDKARIAAIETSEDLRHEFNFLNPGVPVLEGSANDTKLPNESVYNIAVGHSLHCMEDMKVIEEFHRILVPNGHLGIILNRADFNICPFMQEVERVVKSFNADYVPTHQTRQIQEFFHGRPALFTTFKSEVIPTVLTATVDGIVNYLMSTCVIADLPHRRQTDVRLSISRLIEMNPDLRDENGLKVLDLPCVVEFHWAQKLVAGETLSLDELDKKKNVC